jgi:hypothetical protein
MRDFVIDVATTGLPFLADYKEALRRWQAQNRVANNSQQQHSAPKGSKKQAVK